MIVLELATAMICFLEVCHPALVGKDTPVGEYRLELQSTDDPRYGGDLLVFKEDSEAVWAIHRVLTVPGQHRHEKLKSSFAKDRRHVTAGCVNLTSEAYQELLNCCSSGTLIIKE